MAAPLCQPAREERIPQATCSETAGLDRDVEEPERARPIMQQILGITAGMPACIAAKASWTIRAN